MNGEGSYSQNKCSKKTMFLPLYHGPTSFMVISRPYREKRSHAEVDTAQRHMDSGSEEEDYWAKISKMRCCEARRSYGRGELRSRLHGPETRRWPLQKERAHCLDAEGILLRNTLSLAPQNDYYCYCEHSASLLLNISLQSPSTVQPKFCKRGK